MPPAIDKLKPSKGSMIVLILAVTLIVGIALPRKQDPEVQRPVSFQMDSQWDAIVKRSEVSKGSQVSPGDLVMVLVDPKLESEIVALESELKLAELGTMEAIAEPGMLGMIGAVPRVIWESPKPEESTLPLPSKEIPSAPLSKPVKKDTTKLEREVKDAEKALAVVEAKVQSASDEQKILESDVAAAQANLDEAHKEHAKLQKLYDLGAIPKKQLDGAEGDAEVAGIRLNDVKQALAASVAKQEDLQKESVELRAQAAIAKEQLSGAVQMQAEVIVPSPTGELKSRNTVVTQKPRKKVVFGTAPSSFAPVKVNLIEDETPAETKQIEEIRTKLLGLKSKRELLKVKALRAGRVRWIAESGTKVGVGEPLIEIEY